MPLRTTKHFLKIDLYHKTYRVKKKDFLILNFGSIFKVLSKFKR